MKGILRAAALLLLTFGWFMIPASAKAECPLDIETVIETNESKRLWKQVSKIAAGRYEDYSIPLGYVLSRQVQYLGENPVRRQMFDCLFEMVTVAAVNLDLTVALGLSTYPVSSLENFRAAALGVIGDEELKAAGIDVSAPVPSIFDEGRKANGAFDSVAVCRGNGLAANCALPVNTITLEYNRDTNSLVGKAQVVVRRPNENHGCSAWVTSSDIFFSGQMVDDSEQGAVGTIKVNSRVEGFVGKNCKSIEQVVKIDGTWSADLTEDGISGDILTPSAGGSGITPFKVDWE
ncbi:MAG: hypothetical protein AB3N20_14130 [Rhizobiaceae bacterium]